MPMKRLLSLRRKKARGHHPLFFLWVLVGSALLLGSIGSAPYLIARSDDSSNVIPGMRMGNHDIGDMSEDDVRGLIADYQQELLERGIPATYEGRSAIIELNGQAHSPDIPLSAQQDSIQFNGDLSIDAALRIGRSGGPIENLIKRISLLLFPESLSLNLTINRDALDASIIRSFPDAEKKAHEAELFFNRETLSFVIVPSTEGISFDSEKASTSLERQVRTLAFPSLALESQRTLPAISTKDIIGLDERAKNMIKDATLTLAAHNDRTWKLEAKDIGPWVVALRGTDGKMTIGFSPDRVKEYLEKTIAPALFVEAVDPTFEVRDGAVVILHTPQDGIQLDSETSTQAILKALRSNNKEPVQLIVQKHLSRLMNIPEIGVIKEIVGEAETDFSKSPKNRIKNITNGVRLLNGIIVEPEETFSLLSALAPIDATNNYVPELVIKKNKTTPEYGGGLCQVSTTLFRAVAYSGLPVAQRRNHSYRVSYYEPPVGFDATIYDSSPDFKFTNDLTTPLLIQASITGTKIKVTLWGTKDRRTIEVDKPTVYNIKKAPPQKFIETTDLPVGEKKCTEKAHNGADAYFERRITYPDGRLIKEMYKSHYVVWPAVCYLGVKNTAEESQLDESENKQEKNDEPEPVAQ